MSEKDRVQSCLETQKLAREVKQLSGRSADKLADELSSEFYKSGREVDISGGLFRQYLSGKSSASLKRRRDIALAAEKLGYNGHECGQTLYWAWVTLELGLKPGMVSFDLARETKGPLRKLEQALGELLDLGYDESDILFSIEMKMRTLTSN